VFLAQNMLIYGVEVPSLCTKKLKCPLFAQKQGYNYIKQTEKIAKFQKEDFSYCILVERLVVNLIPDRNVKQNSVFSSFDLFKSIRILSKSYIAQKVVER
jgi:hypothetical protein